VAYAFVARKIQQHETARLVLAGIKVLYASFAFYSLYKFGSDLMRHIIPVPFLWLVVVRTDGGALDRQQFPRVLLCLLAALQTLQAYPVYGSQRVWAVFLLVPLAAICFADGLKTILETAKRHLQWAGRNQAQWLRAGIAGLLLVFAFAWYDGKANIAGREKAYWRKTSLALPGASRLRLLRRQVNEIHTLVENITAYCDGFVGLPGFVSLYYWTQIPPPAMTYAWWIIVPEDVYQRAVVEKMRTYTKPCVVYNPDEANSWLRGQALDTKQPLVQYIQQHYVPGPQVGAYTLLLGSERSVRPRH
jgi:hypothetical protein